MTLAKNVVSGKVTKNPEKRFTQNNIAITSFVMDINPSDETLVRVVALGGLAERAESEISIGDCVLTGGELPALCLIDGGSRKQDGVFGKIESADDDSFENGLLEYPQYTKPRVYRGLRVPEVLLNGNHKEINEFRFQQMLQRTEKKRPDLYEIYKDSH